MVISHALAAPAARAEPATVVPVSVSGSPAAPLPGPNSAPAISDDGSVVVFVGGTGVDAQVAVRDRDAATTTLLDRPGTSPAVSGNGCVVAYPAPAVAAGGTPPPPRVDLVVVDRCGDGLPVVLDTVDDPAVEARPALSRDGSVIAWSHGDAIVRYRLLDTGWVRAGVFDTAVGGAPDSVTGPYVDISDDGRTVVFEAGPAGTPFAPDPANIHRWRSDSSGVTVELVSSTDGGGPGAEDSTAPTVSGDGSVVAYVSTSSDLAVDGADSAAVPFVVLDDPDGPPRVLVAEADQAVLAPDGSQLAYQTGAELRAVRWAKGSAQDSPIDELVVSDVGDRPEPAITRHGRWVAFASANGVDLTSDPRFHGAEHVWVAERPPPSPPPAVDLGDAYPGSGLSGTVRFTNDASYALRLTSVTVSAPFEIVTTNCTGLVLPGASCSVDLAVEIVGPGSLTGELVLTSAGWSPIELVTDVLATGLWPPPLTTAPPTTAPPTTSSSTTSPPATATPTTRPPSTYYPYPGGSYYPGGSTTGGSTTSGGSGTFTTTTVVSNPPNLEPGSVDFDPTIVRAGRRTATLLLTDIDGDASVVDVRIRPPASRHFSVVGTSCSGLVPAGGCTIDVEFAPRRTGVLRATLVVELVGGEVVSAALTGTGVPPPTLTVIPDVMVPGQVVTVVGDGFPPSSTVELVWIDGRVVGTPDTGADGTFRETVVVLPRTPAGPAEVRVEAQPDVFRAVRADVLVERRAGVTRSPALRGAGVDVGS